MIDRETLRQLDESFGTSMEDVSASGNDAPNGNNLVGAVNNLQRLLEEMDDYGVSYSDLSDDKQQELDEIVEDLRYHIKKLANLTAETVGADDEMELPNGNTVDIPGQKTAAGPRGQNQS